MTDQLGWHENSKSENKYILIEDKGFWGLIENAGQHFLSLWGDGVADPQAPQISPLCIWGVLKPHKVSKFEGETILWPSFNSQPQGCIPGEAHSDPRAENKKKKITNHPNLQFSSHHTHFVSPLINAQPFKDGSETQILVICGIALSVCLSAHTEFSYLWRHVTLLRGKLKSALVVLNHHNTNHKTRQLCFTLQSLFS